MSTSKSQTTSKAGATGSVRVRQAALAAVSASQKTGRAVDPRVKATPANTASSNMTGYRYELCRAVSLEEIPPGHAG